MARVWRIEYGGALYHVLARVNQKQAIVVNSDDRRLFLATVGEMAKRFQIAVCRRISAMKEKLYKYKKSKRNFSNIRSQIKI